jgi:hypothetical protein
MTMPDSSTGQVAAQAPQCTKEEVESAIAAAKAAYPGWSGLTALKRVQVLYRMKALGEKHLDVLTHSLVLISMGYVTNVSYVAAFRQLSIPISLVFGIFFKKERTCGPKITAVVLLFTGVVLVGLG